MAAAAFRQAREIRYGDRTPSQMRRARTTLDSVALRTQARTETGTVVR